MSNFAEIHQAPIKIRVVVAVCTCQRLTMLAKCLDSIRVQSVPPDWNLHLVVVENDVEDHVRPLIAELAERLPFPVSYSLEPRRGIPYARNRALDEAVKLSCDWLIFIDDDETAEIGWLEGFAQALRQHDADVIHGRVIYQLPKADRWVHLLERNIANEARVDGKVARSAATNNVMISSRLFSPVYWGLQFDGDFQYSGGSDTEFFNRARLRGAKLIYSARPVVAEEVPIERCTLRWLLQREARTSAAGVCIDSRHFGKRRATVKHVKRAITNFFQASGYLLSGLLCIFVKPDKARQNFLRAILRLGRCYGRLLGISGKMLSPYRTIDKVISILFMVEIYASGCAIFQG